MQHLVPRGGIQSARRQAGSKEAFTAHALSPGDLVIVEQDMALIYRGLRLRKADGPAVISADAEASTSSGCGPATRRSTCRR